MTQDFTDNHGFLRCNINDRQLLSDRSLEGTLSEEIS